MNLIKQLITGILVILMVGSASAQTRPTGAEISIKDLGDIKIHSYAAPTEIFSITSYIIESENALVLIDAQMFTPLARDYRKYTDSLGKPINRLIVTHGHPDHYLGLIAFEDIPVYALKETITEIKETGEETRKARKQMMGDVIPDHIFIPTNVLKTENVKIDGITYNFSAITGSEHSPMVITRLPDFGVISVGDAAMNKVHLFLASEFGPWIEQLHNLKAEEGFDLVLAGHGGIGDKSMYSVNIEYLEMATSLIKNGVDAKGFRAGLIEAFPDLGMATAIDFFLPYLFPEK